MVQSDMESQKDKYAIGLPIPGFEVDVSSNQNSTSPTLQSPKPFSPKELKATYQEVDEDEPAEKEVVDKVFSTKRPSKTVIKRMDLSLILQEGAAPELIENIRQLTMAAAKFDRQRGDKLTIMTASFKESRDQRTAEQVMLKNIAEKIDVMERKRSMEATDWRDDIRKYKEAVGYIEALRLCSLVDWPTNESFTSMVGKDLTALSRYLGYEKKTRPHPRYEKGVGQYHPVVCKKYLQKKNTFIPQELKYIIE